VSADAGMTVDVVCAGPVFLDLTFEGLAELPQPGTEHFARELHESPGGAAITAIGLTRLGLRAAIVAPLGRDVAGQTVLGLLQQEGVLCAGPETARTAVTVVLPHDRDRAMVTYEPQVHVDVETIRRLHPRAVVTNVEALHLLPDGVAAFAVVGDAESDRLGRTSLPSNLARAHAVFANEPEAERLTGKATAEEAAVALAEHVETAVVSRGADGAVAVADGRVFEAAAPHVDVRDTTGAGDLLAAAYVWGELGGLSLAERLRRAVVYATLSVQTATGAAGAATLDELEQALAGLGSTIVPGEGPETALSHTASKERA
jgi:sugar/nucleoside kinase (ribokinase family)